MWRRNIQPFERAIRMVVKTLNVRVRFGSNSFEC